MQFKEFVATREMELIAGLDPDLLGEGIWDVGAGLLQSAGGVATAGDEALAKLVGQGQRGRMRRGLGDFAGGLKRAAFGRQAQEKPRREPKGSSYKIEGEKMKFLCPNGHTISIPKSEHGKLVTCPVCGNGSKFYSPFIGNAAERKELGTKRFLARQERQDKFKELIDLWRKTRDPEIQKEITTKFPNEYKAALARAQARSSTSPATA